MSAAPKATSTTGMRPISSGRAPRRRGRSIFRHACTRRGSSARSTPGFPLAAPPGSPMPTASSTALVPGFERATRLYLALEARARAPLPGIGSGSPPPLSGHLPRSAQGGRALRSRCRRGRGRAGAAHPGAAVACAGGGRGPDGGRGQRRPPSRPGLRSGGRRGDLLGSAARPPARGGRAHRRHHGGRRAVRDPLQHLHQPGLVRRLGVEGDPRRAARARPHAARGRGAERDGHGGSTRPVQSPSSRRSCARRWRCSSSFSPPTARIRRASSPTPTGMDLRTAI